jgi:TPR repeat protein
MCGAAGMFVKGEGGRGKNVSAALDYYERAANQSFIRALNGLGFLYFYGDVVEKNHVRLASSQSALYFLCVFS